MDQKFVIVAFAGEPACFAHALLNGLDMQARGWDVKLVIEGRATALIRELGELDAPFAPLYAKARKAGLIDCVCRACANKMGALAAAEAQGLPLADEMQGHPAMARYLEAGYTVITI
ncbi:MAG: cytoplasmic protein [Desulfobulbaceae bacterium]|nr:cytoplasmic protein [Desulfobulbaceae bacterium]HIJ89641.1 cytoplasmic protein [Deltaproteobacteria bacterium]